MARRGQIGDLEEEDDTWFESSSGLARVGRSRVNVWLGLGIVGVAAAGFALGAFASPPTHVDAAQDSMRSRARSAEGTRPLAGAMLLERLDRLQNDNPLRAKATEPAKVEPTVAAAPVVEPEVAPVVQPEVVKPTKPSRPETHTSPVKVERDKPVEAVTPPPVEPPVAEPAPASTIEQAILDGKKHLDARRWAEAKQSYEKALGLSPGNVRALLGRGRALFELRQTTAAMKDFEAVLAAEPSNPNALLMAGSAAQELGRKPDARKFYERYLEAWPTGRRASEIKLLLERL